MLYFQDWNQEMRPVAVTPILLSVQFMARAMDAAAEQKNNIIDRVNVEATLSQLRVDVHVAGQ